MKVKNGLAQSGTSGKRTWKKEGGIEAKAAYVIVACNSEREDLSMSIQIWSSSPQETPTRWMRSSGRELHELTTH